MDLWPKKPLSAEKVFRPNHQKWKQFRFVHYYIHIQIDIHLFLSSVNNLFDQKDSVSCP